MPIYLYHATPYQFSHFRSDIDYSSTGQVYGKGIYLISDDFGSKTDFYKDIQKDIMQHAVSVNNSGYICEKIYWQTIYNLFGNPSKHTPAYTILTQLYQQALSNKLSTRNAVSVIENISPSFKEQAKEYKDYILEVASYFQNKKFKQVSVREHLESRLLKVRLLSDKNLICGTKSLKENGYSSLNADLICQILNIKKPSLGKNVTRKEVLSSLYQMQPWIEKFSKMQHNSALNEYLIQLKEMTRQLNKRTPQNQPNDTYLTKDHLYAVQLADVLITHAFMNTRYLYLAHFLSPTINQKIGIQGMYFKNRNLKNDSTTTWYVITDPSILEITAYKNKQTNWQWQPINSNNPITKARQKTL